MAKSSVRAEFSVDRLGYEYENLKPKQETVVREFLGARMFLHLAYRLRQIVYACFPHTFDRF